RLLAPPLQKSASLGIAPRPRSPSSRPPSSIQAPPRSFRTSVSLSSNPSSSTPTLGPKTGAESVARGGSSETDGLFGNSGACSACGQSIPASELVMRAQGNVYHLKCFTCSTCRNRLVPGDRFHYINGSLFCEHDRPTALINGHLNSLQSNPLLPDQKVC
uniref:LIM domain only 4 n=1 Tax=Equus caballus TaxID=9796 RepID=A0A9L0R2Q7_HORSE